MNRKILFVLICILSLNISLCSAEKIFSSERAAVGGISTGSSTEYTKSIYGDPGKIRISEVNQNLETWFYGDTFQIDFVDGIASAVISSGANGLATPDGITVGMKKRNMTSKYGKPQHSDKYGKRAIYSYSADNGSKMIFVIVNGIISEIRIN